MSRAQKIREWLATQTEPKAAGEIAAAIGMGENSIKAHWTVSVLYRDGFLNRVGEYRAYRYTLSGKAVPPQLTKEEVRRRRLEREMNRGRRNGARPLAEHLAFIKARSAERKAAKEAERLARGEPERRARAAKKLAPKIPKPRKPKVVRVKACAAVYEDRPAPPKRELQQLETVEQFMARGGRIDRLPTFWEQQAAA